jgi:hypothetical protein
MFFALYHHDTGLALGLSGPDLDWAAGEAQARGSEFRILVTDHLLDNEIEKVDVTADPPTVVNFTRIKGQAELAIDVNRERERRMLAGRVFAGVHVTGSDRDQTILLGLDRKAEKLKAAGVTDPVIPFKDGSNVIHQLTPDELMEIADLGSTYVSAIYEASWAIKALPVIPQDVTSDERWP